MNYPTCSTCVHWSLWDDYFHESFRYCDGVNRDHDIIKDFRLDVRADDDQGLSAYLITGPDFGCNLHESKA